MFLTKKALIKAVLVVLLFFVLGGICLSLSWLMGIIGAEDKLILAIGVIAFPYGIFLGLMKLYAEGNKIFSSGMKLVRRELKPAQFLREYESLKASELVVCKPSISVLQLVMVAQMLLDERDKELETVEEMLSAVGDKHKNYVKLLKVSCLFDLGRTEEAEALFCELQGQKLDLRCRAMVDLILKSDRAVAMGDYKIAEAYLLRRLDQRLDNLGMLSLHFSLGSIYEKLQDTERAIEHYEYCVENGGETALVNKARALIKELKG